ncbi:MAG: response regulator transcription factor [Alistipes sp.]|nr:response regulator transcription factor [Alistipes sp.]
MRNVLIIGERGALRDMICCAVERAGVCAECAGDVSAVEADCRRGVYDCVLVLGVSGFIDGRISVERLRPRGVRRPQIYVLSWHHSERAVLSLLECGVNQYITFPIDLRRLCRKVASAAETAL